MFNSLMHRHGSHAHCGCGCPCECEKTNFYRFPVPLHRQMKCLDTTQLTIHTDEIVTEECIKKGCCPPELIKVKDKKKSFVISAVTECLMPNCYYTLQIDRDVPIEAFPFDTYINVEDCRMNFFRGEVGLNFTKSIHWRPCEHIDPIVGLENRDRLESLEVDGSQNDMLIGGHGHGLIDEQFDGGKFGCAGFIPGDPAFPGMNFCGCGFRSKRGVLIPVVLDIHANIATGINFSTGRFKRPGTGAPFSNRFVLFLSNSGKFVLSRDWRRRTDF